MMSFLLCSNDHRTPVFLTVLWNVYGDCDNYATLKGHSGAVMELHYNTDGRWVSSLHNGMTAASHTNFSWHSFTFHPLVFSFRRLCCQKLPHFGQLLYYPITVNPISCSMYAFINTFLSSNISSPDKFVSFLRHKM